MTSHEDDALPDFEDETFADTAAPAANGEAKKGELTTEVLNADVGRARLNGHDYNYYASNGFKIKKRDVIIAHKKKLFPNFTITNIR